MAKKRRSLKTTHEQIIDHWINNLHLIDDLFLDIDNDISKKYKEDLKNIIKGRKHLCWSCYDRGVERCHIEAHQHGGSDDPSNLIHLCNSCHKNSPDVKGQTLDDMLRNPLTERIELENFNTDNSFFHAWINDFGMNTLLKCGSIKKLELFYNIKYPQDLIELKSRIWKELFEDCVFSGDNFIPLDSRIVRSAFDMTYKTSSYIYDIIEESVHEKNGKHFGKSDNGVSEEVLIIRTLMKELQSIENFKHYYIQYLDDDITWLKKEIDVMLEKEDKNDCETVWYTLVTEYEGIKQYKRGDVFDKKLAYEKLLNEQIKRLLFFRKYYGEETRNYIDNNTQFNSMIKDFKKIISNYENHQKKKGNKYYDVGVAIYEVQKMIDCSVPYQKSFV